MRILCFIGLFTVILLSGCGSKDTPNNTAVNIENTEGGAKAAFSKQFPNAQDVMWDSIEVGVVANFLNGNKDSKAFYDKDGHFQYITTVLDLTDIPKNIQDFISKKYTPFAIAIIQEVFDGKNKTYQVELTTNTDYLSLEFNEKGTLLKEIKEPLSNEEMQQQEEEGVEENEK